MIENEFKIMLTSEQYERLCAAFEWVGLALGTVLIVVLLFTTHPIAGGHYMEPLCPFNWKKLRALLLRRPISPENT